MGVVMGLSDFLNGDGNGVSIDFSNVEKNLGFNLHDDLKKFYSMAFVKYVRGDIKFKDKKFLVPTGNKEFDNWFSFNRCNGKIEVQLNLIKDESCVESTVEKAAKEWMGPYDFGRRFMIGDLGVKIGQILILFNNDTGAVEWLDCDYGNFGTLEKDPNGKLANSMEEFLGKLRENLV